MITWNVLHRVHAVNWKEPQIEAFPDEGARCAAIAALVAGWLKEGVAAVCLQEVSGDQLAALRHAVDVTIFAHRYPRLPRVRGEGGPVLDDASEHLVTLASDAQAVASHTFVQDPGKGLVVVAIAETLLVNTHVSFGTKGEPQLTTLIEAVAAADHAVIVGDFNTPAAAVQSAFGPSFAVSALSAPTRVATAEHPGCTIDHVVVRGGALTTVSVLENGGLSDHSPVRAEIALGA